MGSWQTMCFVCECTGLCQLTTNWNWTSFKLPSWKIQMYVTAMQSKHGTLKRLGLGWGVTKDSNFWRLRFLFKKNHNINHNIAISCHNINIRIVTKNNMIPGTLVYHCSTNSLTILSLHFLLRFSFDWADSVKPHFEAPRSLSRILQEDLSYPSLTYYEHGNSATL